MDESFNPYLKWLGISLADQPPNHYRLLGIPDLIDDPDVIENAANRQMGHVRTFATGKHSKLSQQLLNEIAAAKVCLLSPDRKRAYDEHLHQFGEKSIPQTILTAVPVRSQPAVPILRPAETDSAQPAMKNNTLFMQVAIALGLLLVAGIVIWGLTRSTSEEPAVAQQNPVSQEAIVQPANDPPADDSTKPDATIAQKTLTNEQVEVSTASSLNSSGDEPSKEPLPDSKLDAEEPAGDKTNILSQLVLSRDVVDGAWTREAKQLVSPAASDHARLSLPGPVPKEYSLDMELERVSGENMLAVLLVVAGKPAEVFFDYRRDQAPPYSGIIPQERFPMHHGVLFPHGQTRRLECRVTQSRLEVLLDGKTLFDVQDRLDEMSLIGNWAGPNLNAITLGTQRSSFRFTKLVLTPLDSNSATSRPQVAPLTPDQSTSAVTKSPLPEASELEAAQRTFDEVFSKDIEEAKSPEKQKALARTFLSHAMDTKQSLAEAIVLLRAALQMAVQGADSKTAMEIIDKVDERIEIDALEMKVNTLNDLTRPVKTPEEQIALIMAISRVAHDLVALDRFEEAEPLMKIAQSAGLQTRSISLRKEIAVSIKEFDELYEAYRQAEPSFEILKQTPDDAIANLEVGRYRAFIRGAWPLGLQNLAVGNDETLRNLAAKDLAGTDDSNEQLELGDAWWEAAKSEAANMQPGLRLRAAHWYELALPGLSGLARQHVAKRLEEIHELDPRGRIDRDDWKIWTWDGKRFQDAPSAPLRFVDGELSFTNKNTKGELVLLVYQPFVGDRPFRATLEIKGQSHQVGMIDAERSNGSVVAFGTRDQNWHTVTIERQADKGIVVKIDGNRVDVRLWETTYNLEGKIALWILKNESCSMRRFELQTGGY